ncbi:MAG TPA: YolD-like family protein [Aliicoccus persicus]|uniref:YolD-like family protein n=1 Tax=Aliicoccus persicus TaxID=930138 RepID=A0A921JC66_9STAP|nr:YolD-like family protein [Aliicoccus persicus]
MDYRTMSQAELNSNIPRGRGMIKWAPFATMPEQFENVAKMVDAQTKIERPELSDDRIDEMNRVLNYALKDKRPVRIEYYYDGRRYFIQLKVVRVDTWSMILIGEKQTQDNAQDSLVFIPFLDILNITLT